MFEVRLKEIPQRGRQFTFSEEDGIFNKLLQPLIATNKYKIEIYIKPVENIYEITGEINTQMSLTCSRCPKDLNCQISQKINEILFVEKEPRRQKKSVNVAPTLTNFDSSLFCYITFSDTLNLGDYIYEQIVISEPDRPLGENPEACDGGTCPYFLEAKKEGLFEIVSPSLN